MFVIYSKSGVIHMCPRFKEAIRTKKKFIKYFKLCDMNSTAKIRWERKKIKW